MATVSLLLLALSLSASGVRVTVDDTSSDWRFDGEWTSITPSSPCDGCILTPDSTRAYRGTWHDTIRHSTAALSFVGMSIEVCIICVANIPALYTFTLDDAEDGIFNAHAACDDYSYNYLVYGKGNLTLGLHTFAIENTGGNGTTQGSALLLDYAIYEDGRAIHDTVTTTYTISSANTRTILPTVTSAASDIVHAAPLKATIVELGVIAGSSLFLAAFLFFMLKSRQR